MQATLPLLSQVRGVPSSEAAIAMEEVPFQRMVRSEGASPTASTDAALVDSTVMLQHAGSMRGPLHVRIRARFKFVALNGCRFGTLSPDSHGVMLVFQDVSQRFKLHS